MAKKILLTGGCSYTDPKYVTSDPDLDKTPGAWKMWPEHLGEKLELDVVNTGRSGNSNATIYHQVLEKIYTYENRIDTVAILWTSSDRIRTFCGYNLNPLNDVIVKIRDTVRPSDYYERLGFSDLAYNFFSSEDFYKVCTPYLEQTLHDSMRYILSMADICKSYGIKFICMWGLKPFQLDLMHEMEENDIFMPNLNGYSKIIPSENVLLKMYMNNPMFAKIDKQHSRNFIGWPSFEALGGNYFDRMRSIGNKPFQKREDRYNVSERDGHPNAEAQEILSNIYYLKYRELYG